MYNLHLRVRYSFDFGEMLPHFKEMLPYFGEMLPFYDDSILTLNHFLTHPKCIHTYPAYGMSVHTCNTYLKLTQTLHLERRMCVGR